MRSGADNVGWAGITYELLQTIQREKDVQNKNG
jgi:hypothetical protein